MHNKLCGHISTSNTANYCYNPFPTLHTWDPTCSTRINPTAHSTRSGTVYRFTPWVQLWWGLALNGGQQRLQRRGTTSLAVAPLFMQQYPLQESLCILDSCHDMEMKYCDSGARCSWSFTGQEMSVQS